MLTEIMPTKRAAAPEPSTKTQFNIRIEDDIIEGLDAWVDDLNEGRTVPLDRSKLIRGVLRWATQSRPDFERLAPAAAPAKGGRR